MARDEVRHGTACGSVLSLSASKGRAPVTCEKATTAFDAYMEIGEDLDGFRHGFTSIVAGP